MATLVNVVIQSAPTSFGTAATTNTSKTAMTRPRTANERSS
jgi:hypothetical protein